MVVHSGRKHSGSFECGICGYVANDSENLEKHLLNCELYKCTMCDLTFNNLKTLKPHLDEKHPRHMKHIDVLHIKMESKNFDLVSSFTRTGLWTYITKHHTFFCWILEPIFRHGSHFTKLHKGNEKSQEDSVQICHR